MKTSELKGVALDWAVAKCEGLNLVRDPMGFKRGSEAGFWVWEWHSGIQEKVGVGYSPSTDWAQGGLIIERESVALRKFIETGWQADTWNFKFEGQHMHGDTPLEAAMRCYVAKKLGNEIDIPKELV